MNELPDNVKEFIVLYVELRRKAYIPCTKAEASEAGHSRSTHGSNNHRHYSLVADHKAWAKFRNIDRRLKFLIDDMFYYFNPDLDELRTALKESDQQKEKSA